MDPFLNGLLMMFAGSNPEQAGPMMDSLGIPMPGSGGGDPGAGALGQIIPGQMGPFQAGTVANDQAQVSAQQAASTPMAATFDPKNMAALAGLQGVKTPEPIKPIMSGGVTGGVAVPQAKAGAAAGSTPALNMLMQALLSGGSQDPLRVPQLGALMRR